MCGCMSFLLGLGGTMLGTMAIAAGPDATSGGLMFLMMGILMVMFGFWSMFLAEEQNDTIPVLPGETICSNCGGSGYGPDSVQRVYGICRMCDGRGKW